MKQKKIVKEVKENGNGEFYLEFSDKELSMFGLEKGDSVEWMQLEDREIWKKLVKKRFSNEEMNFLRDACSVENK